MTDEIMSQGGAKSEIDILLKTKMIGDTEERVNQPLSTIEERGVDLLQTMIEGEKAHHMKTKFQNQKKRVVSVFIRHQSLNPMINLIEEEMISK